MKSLAEQIGCRCVHFNGMMNKACDAGVVYATVKNEDVKGFAAHPCWREGESNPCEKRHYPTAEEVAAEVAERNASWERLKLGMAATQADAKAKGLKKGNGGAGKVECPVCKTGELHYTVAGCNGHMWGKCSTPNCVSWMQ